MFQLEEKCDDDTVIKSIEMRTHPAHKLSALALARIEEKNSITMSRYNTVDGITIYSGELSNTMLYAQYNAIYYNRQISYTPGPEAIRKKRDDAILKKINNFSFADIDCSVEETHKIHDDIYSNELVNNTGDFTNLKPSTLTAKGYIIAPVFNEETLIDRLPIPKNKNICGILCNFGEILPIDATVNLRPKALKYISDILKSGETPSRFLYNVYPEYTADELAIISGTTGSMERGIEQTGSGYTATSESKRRGRKKKKKRKKRRKPQGSGKYFNSQMTFSIWHETEHRIYKIKRFRNNKIGIPGVRHPEMYDILPLLNILAEYLTEVHGEHVSVKYLISGMRNYTCRFKDEMKKIDLSRLEDAFICEKNDHSQSLLSGGADGMLDIFPVDVGSTINEFAGSGHHMRMAEITYNSERFSGLIVKFYRPVPWKSRKKTAIKMLKSGKINFDGCNSTVEARELYQWLQIFYKKVKKNIAVSVSTDDDLSYCSEESIYDDDL